MATTIKDALYGNVFNPFITQEIPDEELLRGFSEWMAGGARGDLLSRGDVREEMGLGRGEPSLRSELETQWPIEPSVPFEESLLGKAINAVESFSESRRRAVGMPGYPPLPPEPTLPTPTAPAHGIPPTPTPTPPPTPRAPTVAQGVPTAPEPGFVPPAIREPKEGEVDVTSEDLERMREQYEAPPAIPEQIPAPEEEITAEQYGLKPPGYFTQQYKQLGEMYPKSSEEALRQAGLRPEEFRVKTDSPILEALQNFFTGVGGVDRPGMIDKEQARLDQLKIKELDIIFKSLDHQSQIGMARIMMEERQDSQARAGIEKAANFELENLPPDFGSKPGDNAKLANITKRLSMAYRVPPEDIKKYLQDHWNPTTGKYENLYMTPVQKWDMENVAGAKMMMKYDPTLPWDAAIQFRVLGKYPQWAETYEGRLVHEISKSGGDPERRALLQKKLMEFRADNEQMMRAQVKDFAATMQTLVRAGTIDQKTADAAVASVAVGMHQKELGPAILKYKGDIEKAKIEGKAPTEPKAKEKITELEYRGFESAYGFLAHMPRYQGALAGITGDRMRAEIAVNDITEARVAGETGSPEQKQLVQEAALAQARYIAEKAPGLATRIMNSGGFPLNDFQKMDALYQAAASVAIGTTKETQIKPKTPTKPKISTPK